MAKHVTNKTMAIAQQTNARGAADPNPFATAAGITKIPAPMVDLTMFAARARIPHLDPLLLTQGERRESARTSSWYQNDGAHKTSIYCGSTVRNPFKLCDFPLVSLISLRY